LLGFRPEAPVSVKMLDTGYWILDEKKRSSWGCMGSLRRSMSRIVESAIWKII
jgi:hypothetical protein